MKEIKEKLLKMADNLETDINKLRINNSEQLVGSEIMAINALCNIAKTLKEIN